MTRWTRLAQAIALACVLCGVTASTAVADHDDSWRHRHHRGWKHHDGGYRGGREYYYAPERHYYYVEPEVYYAPRPVYVPPPPPRGVISFNFPFHNHSRSTTRGSSIGGQAGSTARGGTRPYFDRRSDARRGGRGRRREALRMRTAPRARGCGARPYGSGAATQ
jgi:hypothetical protein